MLTSPLLAIHLLTYLGLAQVSATTSSPAAAAADKAYSEHEWSSAESQYQQLTNQDPNNGPYWYRLGVSARAGGHNALALQAFEHAKVQGAGKGLPPRSPTTS